MTRGPIGGTWKIDPYGAVTTTSLFMSRRQNKSLLTSERSEKNTFLFPSMNPSVEIVDGNVFFGIHRHLCILKKVQHRLYSEESQEFWYDHQGPHELCCFTESVVLLGCITVWFDNLTAQDSRLLQSQSYWCGRFSSFFFFWGGGGGGGVGGGGGENQSMSNLTLMTIKFNFNR